MSGLSSAGLGRMHDILASHVERGHVPGLVALVSRGGEVHVDAIGVMATGGEPMRRDTIFRITSMTKPITAAAAMILVEESRLQLDEPVDRLLPELAGRRVLRRLDGPLDDTVPAARPITVRDLLTFRLGFGQFSAPPDAYPIQRAAAELGLMTLGPPKPPPAHPPDEWIRRFATLPLMVQPGERWLYNTGSHVLGVLIARASGQSLETFLHERIVAPLGMNDTAFSVPAEKLDRLPPAYQRNGESGALGIHDGVEDSQWSRPPAFPDGGAGLVSTVDDFLTFGRLMLNRGKHRRHQILSARSVEAMTTDQLTPEQKAGSEMFLGARGWGFGMAVQQSDAATVPRGFGWDGGYGTSWASDPEQDMVGILMTQCLWDSPRPPAVLVDFWTAAYEAIDS